MARKTGVAFSIVLLGLGLASFLYMGITFGLWSGMFLVLNLVPCVLLLGVLWVFGDSTGRRRTIVKTVSVMAFLVALAIVACVDFFGIRFVQEVSPVTKISKYSETLERLQTVFGKCDPKLTDHIPRSIPQNASDVTLYYQPPFLQGGTCFQVRYRLPVPELRAIQEQYRPVAREVIQIPEEWSEKGQHIFFLYFRNKENTEGIAPDEMGRLQILVLRTTDLSQVNYGYAAGVAISEEQRFVIYWVNSW